MWRKTLRLNGINIESGFFYPGFLIIGSETKHVNFKGNMDNQKLKTLVLTLVTQNLRAFIFYVHD